MLAKIVHEVTKISSETNINSENYMESINFINNVYNFVNKIKLCAPISKVKFEPSFRGRLTCEKFGIPSNDKENEMKYFVLQSTLFLEDKENLQQSIREKIGSLCESIEFDGEIIRFILK